ncbi:hypothetical protein JVT61DRAFT_4232 [Boletus reticuloceps]|uniref:Tetratricopeptide SHNi-TPR domain-containing protein n=1 Tax=Boletus reticuloceps TaxID=495285 RepID=A0A8I2YN59_9AGAM|nr:hypothetical protein JVT61DRAFT_4232 [Boletus reticuloceps]
MASEPENAHSTTDVQVGADTSPTMTVETALEHARRAFALQKYEQAVEHYATALELQTRKHEEDAPEMADLYFSYGKALLENAISQASVLGKEPEAGAQEEEETRPGNGPILEFGDEGEDEDEDEDGTLDLLGRPAKEHEENDDEDEGEEGEPEDDFNAAWELRLADSYIALGDVSLETEKFDQAITDYSAGLALKVDFLPTSSRQIAEAHYKLSMVLDLTSGRLSDAIKHAEKALESVLERIQELKDGFDDKLPPALVVDRGEDKKGKGKAVPSLSLAGDLVRNMSKSQMESELQEMEGLKEDLALKIDELKTTPKAATESAPALAARVLDQALNAHPITVPGQPAVVHDLTSMVKKKKKPLENEGGAKRKVDDDDGSPTTKKAKLENETLS